MKSKDCFRVAAGSYRFKSNRLAIELWFGSWEVLDLAHRASWQGLPVSSHKTLKAAIKAAQKYAKQKEAKN